MGMYVIKCSNCQWQTNPHFRAIDCIKEKELDHHFGLKEKGYDAHDSAFGQTCPKCGEKVFEEFRFFTDSEIKEIRSRRAAWE